MNLTKNITFEEMTDSAGHRHLVDENREDAEVFIDNLKQLAVKILQPIRDFYGKPLNVHSGFRGNALNNAVGGVKTSQHSFGEACDFHIEGIAIETVFQDIINKKINNLNYDMV